MVHLLHRLYGVDAPGWTAIAGDLVDDDRARQRWPRNTVGPVRYKKGEATVTVTMTMNHFVSVGRQIVTKMHSDTTEMAMKASVAAYFAAWWTATPDDLVDDDPARLGFGRRWACSGRRRVKRRRPIFHTFVAESLLPNILDARISLTPTRFQEGELCFIYRTGICC